MNEFTERTIKLILSIPAGKIMTYGQIARRAGNPRGARQVVWILHTMSHIHHLPWHRVVNAKGEIAIKDDESKFIQVALLEKEGIEVDKNGRISIEKYLFEPDEMDTREKGSWK
ncbi:MAG: MGMT family protein [Bacillus sp. (in: Bacteria)]|nr:MGMT family protein [Bacillus sp. (in: firmicutes)]